MLLYNSAICDLLKESIQIMKIPIHVKVVILVSEKMEVKVDVVLG